MSKKWSVLLKGRMEEEGGYELSVIRKDNKLGHESWGWGDEDKIILFDNEIGGNDLNPCNSSQIAFAKRAAFLLCEALNNE